MAQRTDTRFDPITLEILWSRLISIADESAAALVRTSFSTIVRESNDYATVLMDQNGDSLAENTAGIPSFVGILPRTLKHMLALPGRDRGATDGRHAVRRTGVRGERPVAGRSPRPGAAGPPDGRLSRDLPPALRASRHRRPGRGDELAPGGHRARAQPGAPLRGPADRRARPREGDASRLLSRDRSRALSGPEPLRPPARDGGPRSGGHRGARVNHGRGAGCAGVGGPLPQPDRRHRPRTTRCDGYRPRR